MALLATSFHNSIDNARSYQIYTNQGWKWWPPPITVTQRSLTYEFFPHFHPYVPDLIRRLNDGGFPELQQSDTLYLPQPNPPSGQPLQPLTVVPGSTRATLLANVTATRPNSGPAIALSAGTPITLPDGTSVTVAAGTNVGNANGTISPLGAAVNFTLPGFLPVSLSSGIQNVAGAGAIIVLDFTSVTITLPAGANAVLTSDGSPVQLSANTPVAIRSGLPQPYIFYLDDFTSRYSPDANWFRNHILSRIWTSLRAARMPSITGSFFFTLRC